MIPTSFWGYPDKENIMRNISVLCIALVLCLDLVLFVHASKKPKLDLDGPYTASCVAEIHGASMSGWARVRGSGASRNASYMCSMGTLNTENATKSGRDKNGIFSDKAWYRGSKQGSIYADASVWGSAVNDDKWYNASVSDSDS